MLGAQITVTTMPTVSTLEAVSSVSAEQATRGMEESVQVIIISGIWLHIISCNVFIRGCFSPFKCSIIISCSSL